MYPYLFGNKNLGMFVIMIALGIAVAFALFAILCKKERIPLRVFTFYSICYFTSIFAGFLCASYMQKLYNYIEHIRTGVPYNPNGVTFFGGLIGGATTFILLSLFLSNKEDKSYFYKMVNFSAPIIAVAHAFGRLGCFCAGCCYGIKSEKFGLLFHGLKEKALPTNLYESIFLFSLVVALLLLHFKFKKTNILIFVYGYAYTVFRFFIEFLRGDNRGEFLPLFSPSQWQSIILILVITSIIFYIRYKKTKNCQSGESPTKTP